MTSALDADTEKAIVSTLFDAMKGKSVLVIAHRMSTIRKADEVSNFSRVYRIMSVSNSTKHNPPRASLPL